MNNLDKLKEIAEIQSKTGNYDYNEYSLGLANGLLLAISILEETEVKTIETPLRYKQRLTLTERIRKLLRYNDTE